MLPKKYRLNSSEIARVAKRGKLIKQPEGLFDIRVWYNEQLPCPQFAISISVKIDKRATVRNKIKRKIRAAIQQILTTSRDKLKKGEYLVIVRSDQLKDLEQAELKEGIIQLLNY